MQAWDWNPGPTEGVQAPGSAPLSSRKCVCHGQVHGPSSVDPGGPTIHQHRPVDGTQVPLCAGHTRAPKETPGQGAKRRTRSLMQAPVCKMG